MSRIGKKPVAVPRASRRRRRPDVAVKGPKGELQLRAARRCRRRSMDDGSVTVEPRDETKRARAHVGHVAHAGRQHGHGVTKGFSRSSRSTASAIAPRCRARTCSCSSATATTSIYPIPDGHHDRDPKPTEIVITGIDKQQVGQVAAEIRAFRAARALQGQGREIRRRVHLPQGRQEEVTEAIDGQAHELDIERRQARVRRAVEGRRQRPRRGCRCSARASTSMPRSSTTRRACTLAAASTLEKDHARRLQDRRQRRRPQGGRQAGRRASAEGRASRQVVFDRGGYSITAASRRWPTPPAKAD